MKVRPAELRDIAYWWACGIPIWEARSILRSSQDADIQRQADMLAESLFENLPLAAQEAVISAYRTAEKRTRAIRGDAA